MSGRHIIVFMILAFLGLSYIAAPAYCDDVRTQEQQLLSKAIKMALKIKPLPAKEISDISLYLRNDARDQLSAEALFKHARELAAQTQSADQYADAGQAANSILMFLDQSSHEAAQKLFESWPARPDLGNQYNDFKKRFEADKQRNRLVENPMNYLNENIPVQNINAWMAVLWGLQSRPADAHQAFEHFLSAVEAQNEFHSSTPVALGHLIEPTGWDASLFSHYVNYLKHFGLNFRLNYTLSCSDQSTMLDYSEGQALSLILRLVQNHPDIAAELLRVTPDLKEKVEEVGGIQAIFDRGELRVKSMNPTAVGSIAYKGKDLNTKIDAMCEQSKRNPDEVRQSLTALKSAKDFEFLSWAASASCPAVAETASIFARELTLNEPDAEKRLSMAYQLLPYDYYGARLEPEWIRFGFEILRQAGPRERFSKRSEFEDRLISQLALIDFKRAMAYIDSAQAPLARLQMMLAVTEIQARVSRRAKQ